MTDDSYRKLLEKLQSQFAPFAALEEANPELGAGQRYAEELGRYRDLLRGAYGPMESLRKSGALAALTGHDSALQRIYEQMRITQNRFVLPELTQANKLFEQFQEVLPSKLTAQFLADKDVVARAIGAMHTPWLDTANQIRSVSAFADLQSIGLALRTMPSFGDQFTNLLRDDLGDWRDQINWPEKIFDDAVVRTRFYEERGLDRALTAFPATAFEQSLDIAGLRPAPPDLIEHFDHEQPVEEGHEEAFARNNAAHDLLQRFETQLRLFINDLMEKAAGDQWTKHRVPGEIRKRWIEKRESARANNEPEHPLIAYADFSDYAPIITRKDNWNDAFKPIFGRRESVQESLQRLYPIRICTMHARMITQDDMLYMHVEIRRILIAIGAR